jgi:hypothetical protein
MDDRNFQHIPKLKRKRERAGLYAEKQISHFGTCEVEGDNNKAVGVMEDSC